MNGRKNKQVITVKQICCPKNRKSCFAVAKREFAKGHFICTGINLRPKPKIDKIHICDSKVIDMCATPDEAVTFIDTIASAVNEWMLGNKDYKKWRLKV